MKGETLLDKSLPLHSSGFQLTQSLTLGTLWHFDLKKFAKGKLNIWRALVLSLCVLPCLWAASMNQAYFCRMLNVLWPDTPVK